jgi:hypothetical protein
MRSIFVTDIALASILDSFGVPKRQTDPITREIRERDGRTVESGKWWFDVSTDDANEKAKWIIEAYSKARNWEEYTLDLEHPLFWMKGVLENRVANLHLYHHGATPMKVIEKGDRTVYIGPRLSQADRDLLKAKL